MKNKKLLLGGIFIVFLVSIVGTYAFYTATASNNNVVNATAASANLELTVTKSAGGDTLVPQLTDYLQSALTGTNSTSCIDANGNTVCQVYTITIKNKGTSTAVLTGTLEITAASMDNLKWEVLTGVKTRNSNPTTYSKTDTTLVSSLTLAKNATQTYYVAVWIAETGSAQSDSGNFNGTISFTYASGDGVTSSFVPVVLNDPASQTLAKMGISTSSVKTLGSNYWMSTETNPGIYSYTEDNKINYFWRGQVNNNWVKYGTETISSCTYNGEQVYYVTDLSTFSVAPGTSTTCEFGGICKYENFLITYNDNATVQYACNQVSGEYIDATPTWEIGQKDIYWRIVRITDTGEIRMIYSGTTAPTSSTQYKVLSGYALNNDAIVAFNSSYNSAEYVGYQYTLGSQHGKGTNSNIKNIIDTWYTNNLATNYGSHISTSTYCYDRNTYSGTVAGDNYSGNGVGTINTWFSASHRLVSDYDWYQGGTGPQIYCSDVNDNYSLNSGLLSADEAAIAGLWVDGNASVGDTNNYLYGFYWLGSPSDFSGSNAFVFVVFGGGSLNDYFVDDDAYFSARPVISLNSSVTVSGTGTYDDPYTIS